MFAQSCILYIINIMTGCVSRIRIRRFLFFLWPWFDFMEPINDSIPYRTDWFIWFLVLDESRLIQKRTIEFYHDSTPSATGNSTCHSLSNQSSSSANAHRRKVNNSINPSHMTSFSALKRKSQRSDFSSNLNRVTHFH